MSIGIFSCSYSYGGIRQANRSGSARLNSLIRLTPASTGRNAARFVT